MADFELDLEHHKNIKLCECDRGPNDLEFIIEKQKKEIDKKDRQIKDLKQKIKDNKEHIDWLSNLP